MEKYGKISGTSNLITGICNLSLKIPGTFTGLDPKSPTFSGRTITEWMVWCASPLQGDAVTSITIEDTDGVIPVPARAAFPNYPIIAYREDTALPSGNQGFYVTANAMRLTPPGTAPALPSGLYINLVFVKATPVVDTIYLNFKWDDGALT